MKIKKFLLLLVMQILVVLPLVAQELYTELEREMFGEPSELFINDIVAKPIKASTLNARDGDSINDYQAERQFIDDYLKQINPNFSAGELKVHISLSQKKSFLFEVLYKDVIVDKHKITLHQFIDTAMLITGTTLFNNDIDVEPILTLDQAIEKLKLHNNQIIDESILSNKLVIYKALGGEPYLCYKIEVFIYPIEHYYYYVSAVNGNIVWRSKLTRDFSSETGIANLHNWGTKNILTSYDSSTNSYFLFNQPCNIQTYDLNASVSGLVRSEKYDDAPEFIVSTDGLAPGIYFMRIYRNGEFLDTQKLIVK